MPATQVAQRSHFEFGAPATLTQVLLFKVLRPGRVGMRFENPVGDAALVVSVQVGDNATPPNYAATSVAQNAEVITSVSVPQRTFSPDYTVLLRSGVDGYVKILASGNCRAAVILTGDAILQQITF